MPRLLRVQVLMGKGLLAKDFGGTSDPYVVVHWGKNRFETDVIRKTLTPCWDAVFDLPLNAPVPHELVFNAWDKDFVGRDFLGYLSIPTSTILGPQQDGKHRVYTEASVDNGVGKWYKLQGRPNKHDEEVTGDILINYGIVTEATDDLAALSMELNGLAISPAPSSSKTTPAVKVVKDDEDNESLSESVTTRRESLDSSTSSVEDFTNDSTIATVTEPITSDMDASLNKAGSAPMGLFMIDVVSAENLPKGKSAVPNRFDMDPFCVISFGKKTFRTKKIRHNLNPKWDERLYVNVKSNDFDSNYKLTFSIYDHDKLSSHDYIGNASFDIADLLTDCEKAGYEEEDVNNQDKDDRVLAKKKMKPELRKVVTKTVSLANPKIEDIAASTLTLRFRFTPYKELRRNFWLSLCRLYDSDDNGNLNFIELSALLDCLGSTLSNATIEGLFLAVNKNPETGELTYNEVVQVLDERMARNSQLMMMRRASSLVTASPSSPSKKNGSTGFDSDERVIQIKECPFCHRPSMKTKEELDILSHIAICANEDLSSVDNFVMGGFLTEAHATRKWFTKVLHNISYGRYGQLEKNTGHILVQDRETGQIIEEKIPTYIRLGIRIMYASAGAKSVVESTKVKNLLKKMSIRQGKKFDNPRSAKEIEGFIKFHKLSVDEILDPLDSFKTFNEFFYRKLKPSARPLSAPENPNVLVSPADCRMSCFPTVPDATRLWIKGVNFSLASLLQDEQAAKEFSGCALGIFRLSPQDYHRFHSPVSGIVGETKKIEQGCYYTVNPMAVRSEVDVYTDNVRSITYIESSEFGKVAFVAIGAMMVGSIILTGGAKQGERIERGDEFGYFAFGGSTILVLGNFKFDRDLVENSESNLETLVKVRNTVGFISF